MTHVRREVSLVEASTADQPVLRRLMQLYCYDFSGFIETPINPDGTFGDTEFIEDQFGPDHQTFVIRIAGDICGFAVVTACGSASPVNDMAQFFVLRGRRRDRVGEAAAAQLFAKFRGPWEVRVIEQNTRARAFWRAVIDRFTCGSFDERQEPDGTERGTVFRFTSVGE